MPTLELAGCKVLSPVGILGDRSGQPRKERRVGPKLPSDIKLSGSASHSARLSASLVQKWRDYFISRGGVPLSVELIWSIFPSASS